jgi:hypothetical protein
MNDLHMSYIRHWETLIDLEEKAIRKPMTFWAQQSSYREQKGEPCMGNLWMVSCRQRLGCDKDYMLTLAVRRDDKSSTLLNASDSMTYSVHDEITQLSSERFGDDFAGSGNDISGKMTFQHGDRVIISLEKYCSVESNNSSENQLNPDNNKRKKTDIEDLLNGKVITANEFIGIDPNICCGIVLQCYENKRIEISLSSYPRKLVR